MSKASEAKQDRRYTKEHEWAREDNGEIICGITPFAVEQLGDITLVSLDVQPGASVKQGEPFGTVESVKTVSDLFAPVSGTITRLNELLETRPELVNEDCWGQGWMVAIAPAEGLDQLMDHEEYRRLLEASADG